MQYKNKLELIQMEVMSKDAMIEQFKDENESLQEKSKKWISKLD